MPLYPTWRLKGEMLVAPSKLAPTQRKRICRRCGKEFYQNPDAKYCRDCRYI